MILPTKISAAGTLVRHGGLALTGGLAGALGEWAGMAPEATGLLVVLTVAVGATRLFLRSAE